jgi:hypothetical protein
MTVRRWIIAGGLAAFIAAGLSAYFQSRRQPVNQATAESGQRLVAAPEKSAHSAPNITRSPASTNGVDAVIHVNANNVLAIVNGRPIKLADLIPLNPARKIQEQEFSATTYKFLLDRAVNRELTLQAAKAQGVELDDSQRQQLSQYRGQRNLPEPGLLQQLNVDASQIDFEVRDAEAFMLQTALLDKSGASANVTEQEAQDYYNQHLAEFGALPPEEPARSRAWADIDFQIRTQLAPSKRAQFQTQLSAYMDQLRSGANIAMSPMP